MGDAEAREICWHFWPKNVTDSSLEKLQIDEIRCQKTANRNAPDLAATY